MNFSWFDVPTVLHEFGHALGLVHEHFQPDCQSELELNKDDQYQDTTDSVGQFIRDANGHRPGALKWMTGYPFYNETVADAAQNLILSAYEDSRAGQGFEHDIGWRRSEIDQRSIMLYDFPDYVLKGGPRSACRNLGGGQARNVHFATELSSFDKAYYQIVYRRR